MQVCLLTAPQSQTTAPLAGSKNFKSDFSPLIGGGGRRPEGVVVKIYPIIHYNAFTNHIKILRGCKNK